MSAVITGGVPIQVTGWERRPPHWFALWGEETANMIGTYATIGVALEAVRAYADVPDFPMVLEMGFVGDVPVRLAHGDALLAWAKAVTE